MEESSFILSVSSAPKSWKRYEPWTEVFDRGSTGTSVLQPHASLAPLSRSSHLSPKIRVVKNWNRRPAMQAAGTLTARLILHTGGCWTNEHHPRRATRVKAESGDGGKQVRLQTAGTTASPRARRSPLACDARESAESSISAGGFRRLGMQFGGHARFPST